MAGYSEMYVLGGQGGFMGADGVNPIEMLVLVGNADRMWLEPHYFDPALGEGSGVRAGRPQRPQGPKYAGGHPDCLRSVAIHLMPRVRFRRRGVSKPWDRIDFDQSPESIPAGWEQLREQARPIADALNIWFAAFEPLAR